MKDLYLLRHAQADMGFDQNDIDRPLTDHGYAQAKNIAPHLKNIDVALCSNAMRTRETLETIIKNGTKPKDVVFTNDLYNADTQTLLDALYTVDGDNVLIVAHNPGIHLTAYDLMEQANTRKHDLVLSMYPPCSLTILECPIDDWQFIEKKKNKLIDFITV